MTLTTAPRPGCVREPNPKANNAKVTGAYGPAMRRPGSGANEALKPPGYRSGRWRNVGHNAE